MRRYVGGILSEHPAVGQSATQRGVHQAGTLFLVLGAVGFSAIFIPGITGYGNAELTVVVLVALLVGSLTRTPQVRRLSGCWSLLLAAVGLSMLAISNIGGLLSPVPLGIYFIVIFVWIGQWHPPGTALRFAPVGVLAYLLPLAAGAPRFKGEAGSVVIVIAASVMIAELLARQATVVRRAQLEQAEALEALARASMTDDLTGLGNRRLGNRLLEELAPGDLVVILDLDHFKQVNDQYGHARGDLLLQELGAFLQHEVVEPDTVARMGGEEFLLVLKGAASGSGTLTAERLLRAWHQTSPLASLSGGAAMYVERQSPSTTYKRADAALYEAKAAGRSRMILADLKA